MQPTVADVTPGRARKFASMPQKQPAANVAFAMTTFYPADRRPATLEKSRGPPRIFRKCGRDRAYRRRYAQNAVTKGVAIFALQHDVNGMLNAKDLRRTTGQFER